MTPEAVTLSVDVGGLGSRTIALFIDVLIQLAVVLGILSAVGAGDMSSVEIVVISLVLFAIIWGYYPVFEFFLHGRTPGKATQRLRVVRTDGQPAGGAAILVRNLIRILDVFLFPFLAVISMIVTARAQRLGDLAAGTMVVREARFTTKPSLPSIPRGPSASTARLDERNERTSSVSTSTIRSAVSKPAHA